MRISETAAYDYGAVAYCMHTLGELRKPSLTGGIKTADKRKPHLAAVCVTAKREIDVIILDIPLEKLGIVYEKELEIILTYVLFVEVVSVTLELYIAMLNFIDI